MLTIVVYVVVTLIVAVALFALSLVVFGRSEVLPPVARDHTVTHLPDGPPSGDDLRSVRFGVSARGYTMAEVDWALEQAAVEIDRLRARLGDDAAVGGDVVAGEPRTAVAGRSATTSGDGRTR